MAGCSRDPFEGPVPEKHFHYTADVADERAMVEMIRAVRHRFGGITVLINNAGIAAMNHLLLTPLSTVQRIFSTNVFGTFVAMRECAKTMVDARYGRIGNSPPWQRR